jgi:hypothetical protein
MSSSGLPKPSGLKPPTKISRPCTVTPKPGLPLAATPSARASEYYACLLPLRFQARHLLQICSMYILCLYFITAILFININLCWHVIGDVRDITART